MAGPLADFVVSLGVDGSVETQGSTTQAFINHDELSDEAGVEEAYAEVCEDRSEVADQPEAEVLASSSKLVVDEEVQVGRVGHAARMSTHLPSGVLIHELTSWNSRSIL